MCTRQVTAFRNPSGGRPIFGWSGVKEGLQELKLPCGRCPECLKDYYTSWATRGAKELLQWETSLFITLTYNDENLPEQGSLKIDDVQKFIKRVKKYFRSTKENPIRQIYCGEYGSKDKTQRPHYHVILFNCDFSDKEKHRISDQGHQIFISQTLDRLWSHGFAEFGIAQPGSVAYLFKYILKKKTRKERERPLILERDGVTYEVEHEFIQASRNPGIGAYLRSGSSLKKGFLSVDGVKKKLPKYYLEWLRINDPDTYDFIQNLKFDFMSKRPKENPKRMRQKEFAQKKLTDTKKRL